MNSQEAWQKQKTTLEYYKRTKPELITRTKIRPEAEIFQEIGIANMPANRPSGYLRLYYEDFIVEEKAQDQHGRGIIRVNGFNHDAVPPRQSCDTALYGTLTKIGITTNLAVERLSQALNYRKNIGYAGLKDDEAITAQLICFNGIKLTPEQIRKIKIPNIYLSNFYYGQGTLRPGYLDGNYFTITVRTKDKVNANELNIRIDTLAKYGFLNYFHSQRFGGLKLISHKIGKLILQGNYELAVRYILFKTNPYEMPLITELKKQAEKIYPDHEKIRLIFQELPFSFHYEIKILDYLISAPEDFIGALREIKDSITVCLYAYSSLLFNKYISDYSKTYGCINEEFPLLLSNDQNDHKIYRKYLEEDNINDIFKNLRPLNFVYLTKRQLAAKVYPKNIVYKTFDHGTVINFFLPKGAYATTFLANLFELHEGAPAPEWVSREEIDPKKLLGRGDLSEVKEIFKDYWDVRLN